MKNRFPSGDWLFADPQQFGSARHVRGGGPRHRGGPWRGGPGFGGPPGFGAFAGGPRGRGRGGGRRRRGDVRMALLMLLGEEPRNGYQLMQVIEERSGGSWRPSPGSVYPVLSQLEDEGLIRATEHEGSRLFELTDAGRDRLAEAKDAPAPWEEGDDGVSGRREMRRLVGEVAAAAMQVSHLGDDQQIEQAAETMKNTRRTLYRILADEQDV